MGNSLSSWGGKKKVQSIITSAGLPLKIDDDGPVEDHKGPLSPFTEAYPAKGWFTGVRSQVTIQKPPDTVYNSLSKDLHKVFTPMSECDDEIEEDDKDGTQVIFRIVRIPFKVAFVTGNLKLRLHVEQSRRDGKVHFESTKAGRLITAFIADFSIVPKEGAENETVVTLDAKINAHSLPPPPFKGMVKDVMVKKMDSCMVDLVEFHSRPDPNPPQRVLADGRAPSAPLPRRRSIGFLAHIRKSLGRRPSLEKRRSDLQRAASAAAAPSRQQSGERLRNLDWRNSFDKPASLSQPKPAAQLQADSAKQIGIELPSGSQPTSGSQASVFAEFQARTEAAAES